jgi:signal peptidase I
MGVLNASACHLVSEAVRKAGRVRLRVSGASMVPSMRPGDLITVERACAEEISPGEIVVFAREGRLVVHRVTAKVPATAGNPGEPLLKTRLLTRGDRARRDDPLVSSSELLGRVTQIRRGSRAVRLRTRLSAAEQVFCRLLRISDRATSLYLRVSAL